MAKLRGFQFTFSMKKWFFAKKMVPYGTIFSNLWYRMVPFFIQNIEFLLYFYQKVTLQPLFSYRGVLLKSQKKQFQKKQKTDLVK